MTSSTTLLTIFLIVTVSLLPFGLSSEPEGCSEPFVKLAQQRNISDCKRLRTLGAQFAWSYHSGSNSSIVLDIMFSATIGSQEGWMAWGVNPGKRAEMIGTNAIIGIKSSDDSLRADTYKITKETKRGCSLTPSKLGFGLSDANMTKTKEDNVYTIYARLTLPSQVYNVSRLNHVWQVGYHIDENRNPLRHPTTLRNVDSTEVINMTSSTGFSTGQYRSFLRSVHGVLNIIGWGTLLPIGIIVARYFRVFPFKCDPTWFHLHIGCQLTGFLVGTTGWAIGLSLGHSSRYYTFHAHRTFGILIFTLSTIQMLAFRLKPKVTDDYRKYWNMYHHFLGYGLLAIIFINIFKGICILEGGKRWKWGYIGNLIFLATIAFGLEVFTWIRFFVLKARNKAGNEDPNKHNKNKQVSVGVTKPKP